MAEPGDKVLITTNTTQERGLLIPSPDSTKTLIKLDTGYNVGFHTKDIVEMNVVEKALVKTMKNVKVEKNPSLATISILHTGGTIASKVDYRTGGVSTEFTPEQLVSLFPELTKIANIESELVAQMWSDELRFDHFEIIAQKVRDHVEKGSAGIIIGMGTDNLAVASAALSFIIEESPVPIILVGSQRSSDRGSSDAAMNLMCAARFILATDYGGVGICMHHTSEDTTCAILPGTKTYKLHSSRRDAFKVINDVPIAIVDYATGKITYQKEKYTKRSQSLTLKPTMESKVGLLKVHIHMMPEQFSLYHGYKGLIIEGTGLGQAPTQVPTPECQIHKRIGKAIKSLVDSGCVVVMTTQCLFGTVNMNVYDQGRDLLELGVVPGKDMLSNTAFVKLSWLLGNYSVNEVKKLIGKNLRGEINETLGFEEEFI